MSKKTIIATAALVVGILLFAALVMMPLLRAIRNDSANLETQYARVLQVSSAEKEMAEFLKFSQAQKDNFETIENIFVDAKTPIDFIQFVEEIAATSNLSVRITPESAKKQKGAPWPVMDFTLISTGGYPSFLSFLEKLENGPYLVSVQNTSVTRNRTSFKQENGSKDISFTLLLEVFTGPLPESTL